MMTLNTDMKDISDLTDAEIEAVRQLCGHPHPSDRIRSNAQNGYGYSKAIILLTRSLKKSHPEMFPDPDAEAVRKLMTRKFGLYWSEQSDEYIKNTWGYEAYVEGKADSTV